VELIEASIILNACGLWVHRGSIVVRCHTTAVAAAAVAAMPCYERLSTVKYMLGSSAGHT
jgi:hypothetical protein